MFNEKLAFGDECRFIPIYKVQVPSAFQLCSKSNKSEAELEREHSLMGQWVSLTEERTAVSIPAPNSDIPGAPCDW